MQGPWIRPAVEAWAKEAIVRMRRELPASSVRNAKRRRLAIVHLDGVPKSLLDEAIASGAMPFFSRAVRTGRYRLARAFWGSPASTPCFQAALLYGRRHPNLPAYKWFDRELGRLVEMNVPADCDAVETRLRPSEQNSLLAGGGTSYLSLFRASAENLLSMSSLAHPRELLRALGRDLHGIRASSHGGAARAAVRILQELWHGSSDTLSWIREVRTARFEGSFLFNRVFLSALAWQYAHSRALLDMAKGVPALYLVYGSYDEVAHRRGPRSAQAVAELHRVDAALEELCAVAELLEPGYDVYFLTDHGHVDSAPFEQRAGRSLERFLLEGGVAERSPDTERFLLAGRAPLADTPVSRWGPSPVVVDAGNFAHVYLDRGREPLEARELLAQGPDLLARACASPDVGLAVVRQGQSAVALVRGEPYSLADLERAPLDAAFSRPAVEDLMRELPFMPTAGDLVLFGKPLHMSGTVGFAWEFGSHGGLTHVETDSVICWPANAPLELSELRHATQLHARLGEVYRP